LINRANFKLYPLLFIGIIFLFFGTSTNFDFRLVEYLWNLGHIALGFIAALIVKNDWLYFKNKHPWNQLLIIVILSFIAGIIIEAIQSQVGRDSSWNDVFLDVLGAITAIVFFSDKFKYKVKFKWSGNIVILLLYIYALAPFLSRSADELVQLYQFPILSNFEIPYETSRWHASEQTRSKEQSRSGNYSLKAKVAEYKYHGVEFNYFIRDWSAYKTFNISIFNTLDYPISISIKIYDKEHYKSDKSYHDRFNKEYSIKPGWNDIKIKISQIQEAPKSRKIDLQKIRKVSVFPLKKQKPFILYFDDVYLK